MKVLEYIIRALDKSGEGNKSARSEASRTAGSIMSQMANIKAAWDMGSGAIISGAKAVWSAVKEAFKFETLTVQFSVLMGSMSQAKDRMKELADFAAKTPFSMEEAVVASRQLHVFSNGALGAMGSLKMVGDAAAAVGGNMQEVSFWVGRAYSMIKGGQPFGEAAMRLQELGLITPEVRTKMEDLQAAGASNAEVWAVLEQRLNTFKGGMEQLSKTGDGLTSTLKDNWTAAVRALGEAFQDGAKNGITVLSDKIQELTENGSIANWMQQTIDGFQMVGQAALNAWGKFTGSWLGQKVINGAVNVGALATYGVARLTGNSASDSEAAGNTFFARHGVGKSRDAMVAKLGYDPKEEAQEERAADKKAALAVAAAKKADEKAKANSGQDKAAEEKAKIAADLKKTQDEIDKKRALEVIKKQEEERQKSAVKEAEERQKLAEQQIEDEHKARVDNIREEAQVSAQSEMNARDRLSRANSAAQQAWGWYRDPDSFKRQLAEEKADAAAEKQYGKDLDRLNNRSDWRTTTRVTDSEEAVRRVALAREEQTRAQQALISIDKHTAGLEAMLKDLLTSK